jgi:predicted ABC-type ATPase
VPENKIRDRYRRLWPLVADAIGLCDTASVYDNSGLKGPRIVAQISGGFSVGSPSWPAWAPSPLRLRWP